MALTKLNYTGQGTIPIANIPTITAKMPAGSVLQTFSTFYTGLATASANQSPVDVSGFSVAITPSSTSSKILVSVDVYFGFDTADPYPYVLLLRNGTSIGTGTTPAGNRIATFLSGANVDGDNSNTSQYKWIPASRTYLDSPSSTSEVIYKIQLGNGHSSVGFINRQGNTDNQGYIQSPASGITVQEIKV